MKNKLMRKVPSVPGIMEQAFGKREAWGFRGLQCCLIVFK